MALKKIFSSFSLNIKLQADVDANYNMDMWVKQCDKGIVSCFEAKVNFNNCDDDNDGDDCMHPHNPNQGDYDNQLPTFRGCAGTAFPHDEKCAYEKQVKKEKKK